VDRFQTVEAAAVAGVHLEKCADDTCHRPKKPGASKYCADHALAARHRWLNNVRTSASAAKERAGVFERLFAAAHMAGHAAAMACTPRPMIVRPGDITLNGANVDEKTYFVSEGACGFAWVTIRPANCSAALYAKKHLGWRTAYGGGMQLWVSEYNQSVARKSAYAEAYADVLGAGHVNASAGSRLD
jgi:hypothetical protein